MVSRRAFILNLSTGYNLKMPWFVYICESRFGHLYTGITTNPEERIVKHNLGEGSQMGKEQGPFKLLYVSKEFPNKSLARTREIQIKGWAKAKKMKLVSGEWS